MKAHRIKDRSGHYWVIFEQGALRPIISEGESPEEAEEGFVSLYAKQYAMAESYTAASIDRENAALGEVRL